MRTKTKTAPQDFLSGLGQMLCVYKEKIDGKGEDACFGMVTERAAAVGCFDGCGGIGARRYENFRGHTGAYVASRVTAEVVSDWFLEGCEKPSGVRFSEEKLTERIAAVLKTCREREQTGSALRGTLTREFPTTLAVALLEGENVIFYWAGDSRGYILDETGLHQLTADDVEQQDAMRNIREDGALKNVISASRGFRIHRKEVRLRRPGMVFTCTDGCFGYLDSPMAFEALLLETLQRSQTPCGWERAVREELEKVAGDDFSLMALLVGVEEFEDVRRIFERRCRELAKIRGRISGQEGLERWWQEYRKNYEAYEEVAKCRNQ